MRALLRVTIKAPLLVDSTLNFLLEIECLEGVEILSRKYLIDHAYIEKFKKLKPYDNKTISYYLQINANQTLKF